MDIDKTKERLFKEYIFIQRLVLIIAIIATAFFYLSNIFNYFYDLFSDFNFSVIYVVVAPIFTALMVWRLKYIKSALENPRDTNLTKAVRQRWLPFALFALSIVLFALLVYEFFNLYNWTDFMLNQAKKPLGSILFSSLYPVKIGIEVMNIVQALWYLEMLGVVINGICWLVCQVNGKYLTAISFINSSIIAASYLFIHYFSTADSFVTLTKIILMREPLILFSLGLICAAIYCGFVYIRGRKSIVQ